MAADGEEKTGHEGLPEDVRELPVHVFSIAARSIRFSASAM
jgi:hypothetical protein